MNIIRKWHKALWLQRREVMILVHKGHNEELFPHIMTVSLMVAAKLVSYSITRQERIPVAVVSLITKVSGTPTDPSLF